MDTEETDARYYLDELIIEIYEKIGKRVVILIDEYDKPITNNLGNIQKAEATRDWLREFYEKFKAAGEYIHFFFMTGISKFAKMSIFSALNNLKDIFLLQTVSSRRIRKVFKEHIGKCYWKSYFWTRAYCIGSAGGAPLDLIRKYIENQKKP